MDGTVPLAAAGVDRPRSGFGRLLRAKSLVATVGFGMAGLSFTLGNLLLAREMDGLSFGYLSLAVAIYNVCIWLAPMGMDQALVRRDLDPGPGLAGGVGLKAVLVAMAAAGAAAYAYGLPISMATKLGIAIVAGGMAMTAGLGLRRHGWATLSLIATNTASWSLLIGGAIGLVFHQITPDLTLAILAAVGTCCAVTTWGALMRNHRVPLQKQEILPLSELASLMAVAVAGALIVQIERFVIPRVLDFHALALFAVLASIAIFPFRLLRSGSSFAIVPRLHNAVEASERRALMMAEGRSILVMVLIATVVVTLAAPTISGELTNGKYQVGTLLVLAGCFNGSAKLIESLPRSVVIACGTTAEVHRLGWLSWLIIAANVVGACALSPWGLTALVCGGAIGSLIGSWPTVVLARRAIRRGYVGQPLPNQACSAVRRQDGSVGSR